jgi:putative transposase
MARLPRLNIADIPQHVVQRGNNRQPCFITRRDRAVYLKKLKEFSTEYSVSIHAFVLMTNHVHLLVTPTHGDGVSYMMQALGRYYVRYFNKIHKRTGTLWEGRFKSCLVDTENYFLIVSRYIELNPVRAKMVSRPEEYSWSSYHHNALNKKLKLITPHSIYCQLGDSDIVRSRRYSSLFEESLLESKINEIRRASSRSWVLGDENFKLKLEKESGVPIIFNQWGGARTPKIN